ncbi:14474_t:CDS:2 [Racocetra persica]|uniref:14474_t:CDS:1 n=1 Tax=Racocetra persica TaxID=160502 RepID=A0ACA9NL53_9GLOM|nr:14474_t:CDS:2 [Racocetra persica]
MFFPNSTNSDLSDSDYHRISDATMEHLLEFLENLNDQLDFGDFDIEYSVSQCKMSGVLTLKCGSEGTYVLNKQPPNKQIWLSSPIRLIECVSGPKRYDYDLMYKKWFYHRDNTTLDELLNNELSTIFCTKVDVSQAIS